MAKPDAVTKETTSIPVASRAVATPITPAKPGPANVSWQATDVTKAKRAQLKGQKPCCLWFTGLSGSGKSTIANRLERELLSLGRHTYILDGDNVRHGLCRDLGFSDADRVENIRRAAHAARLMADAGLIVVVAFISPFRAERRMARELFEQGEFVEVFVDTPLDICEQRDPKGLYQKARKGLIPHFTGISSPYEVPEGPEIHLACGNVPPEKAVEEIIAKLRRMKILQSRLGWWNRLGAKQWLR